MMSKSLMMGGEPLFYKKLFYEFSEHYLGGLYLPALNWFALSNNRRSIVPFWLVPSEQMRKNTDISWAPGTAQ